MRSFYHLLFNTLIAGTTNNFVWFGVTFWVYLETKSVLATAYIAGIYLIAAALSSFWFGFIVDHNKKKTAMMGSSIVSLAFYVFGFIVFLGMPEKEFQNIANPALWLFVILLMLGVIAGNIRNIALPTLVTILVSEKKRDKANGLVGTVTGVGFALTSVFSGLVLAHGGMFAVLVTTIIFTILAIMHLVFVSVLEKKIVHTDGVPQKIDIKGTLKVIRGIPGLWALIFFNVINNFLGGVFMSLMDAYGLSLVSVQTWGFIWGMLSFGFIAGGMIVAKKGLGKNPLRTMFLANILMWAVASVFTIQPWILLLVSGMAVWMIISPIIEASEQTVIQKVVPLDRQGRVFGFGQSVEQAASPLVAFIIGPIAQFFFIPFMTTGAGVKLIGWWFGTGQGRGIALVFTITSIIGLLITLFAMRTRQYKQLSKRYLAPK